MRRVVLGVLAALVAGANADPALAHVRSTAADRAYVRAWATAGDARGAGGALDVFGPIDVSRAAPKETGVPMACRRGRGRVV